MRILLTNDDGYNSEGIIILEQVLKSYGHKVSVCAPSNQRSASSHSVSLRDSINISSYGKDHYHCSGTPADCLLFSFRGGLFDVNEFDLVISGINHGLNVSSDILYSGTVSAAREAVMIGVKAIAISLEPPKNNESYNFENAAIFLAEHLDVFYPLCTTNSIININVPHNMQGNWKTGSLGLLDYRDAAEVTNGDLNDIKNSPSNAITLGLNSMADSPILVNQDYKSVTDFELISKNIISVSILEVLPAVSSLQKNLLALEREA
jgi:5'-nucleotidase